ncbi:LysE family translocator [Pseudomonas stutzeri]|uniref:Lysine transporter LysE n=1 Tax=Stutzerimonas stutzeri TaxID=316 RepID=A0A2N8SL94_STUST|nr:LysE family translocator [Stutzerimonas stutzeri]MCQ4251482.1 LysE family translocator [Stutzerimonas stutzeri]PNG03231.1 lysine transporter LysE [Stutzerimonas stutzeri]
MIDLPLLLAFIAAASLLTVTPGVDTAIVLRTATLEGRRQAVLAGAGICLGCLAWGVAVSLGLGALLQASELAYTVVKFAGAAYLIWLGSRLLFRPRASFDKGASEGTPTGNVQAFWRGLLTNLLNPKIGVFYVTFLPQFVPLGADVAGYSFFLACLHVLLTLAWFAVLIAATVPLGKLWRRPALTRALDRVTGGVLVAFGVRLATSSAP